MKHALIAALLLSACGAGEVTPSTDPLSSDAVIIESEETQDAGHEDATALDTSAMRVRNTDTSDAPTDCLDVDPSGEARASDAEGRPTDAPPEVFLTVNEVPQAMNGSEAWTDHKGDTHPFMLRVNHANFTLDLIPSPSSGAIDWESLSVTCDAPLGRPGGGILVANSPLPLEAFEAPDKGRYRRLRISPESPAAVAPLVHCTSEVSGPSGTSASSLSFESAPLPEHLDPFVTPDTWLIVLSRDIAALSEHVHADTTVTLSSTHVPEGDGVLDFDEAFFAMGLFSEDNDAARARVKALLLEVVRDWTYQTFYLDADGGMNADSVPITLYFEGDPGAPSPEAWDGSFSMIALGGDGEPEDQAKGTVGMALLDPNNQSHEDNSTYGLGVFTTGVVRQALANPLATLLLASILPHTGTPIGDHPDDAVFLDPNFDPDACHSSELLDRYTVLGLCLEFIGLAIGATLSHEIGHSLGLVPPGPPPLGLFAGVKGLSFTDNTLDDAHIDTPGLNVMQTGKVTNWLDALSQDPSFNALNRAYLQRRLVVGQ